MVCTLLISEVPPACIYLDGADRDKSIDEARRFIDLANEINCPYIRVFPNNLPKDVDKKYNH